MSTDSRRAIIIGAGPAGLTAALELLRRSDIVPIVLEATGSIGGISQTVIHHGNRIDIGGHRFFSKDERVNRFWSSIMPLQDSPAKDELLLGAERAPSPANDPELTDNVLLKRRRVSRIYYRNKFFDYPISLSAATLRSLGPKNILKAGAGYCRSLLFRRKEESLEDFYINRFGKPLYSMFFEAYTEKVWGVHPSGLSADWGSQRIKGLSILTVLKNVARKIFSPYAGAANIETSLIEEFIYPKYGPGQIWEAAAKEVERLGGKVIRNAKVTEIKIDGHGNADAVVAVVDGKPAEFSGEWVISSMPLSDLFGALRGITVPDAIMKAATSLPYRDFITVGLLLNELKIKNRTKLTTYLNRVPDTWIYIQERHVKLGRLQIFNNWSPYMVSQFEEKIWIGLEYFCNEGDALWNMADEECIGMAIKELEAIGIIDSGSVEDSVRIRMPKAYPAYLGSYREMPAIRGFIDSISNLYCIGRNGQHRYNNMDHSMLTAMKTVDNIIAAQTDKSNIWEINTSEDYHESGK